MGGILVMGGGGGGGGGVILKWGVDTPLNIMLNLQIQNIESYKKFKDLMLSFIKTKENSFFGVYDVVGLKVLTCLKLEYNQNQNIHKHKF